MYKVVFRPNLLFKIFAFSGHRILGDLIGAWKENLGSKAIVISTSLR